MPALNQNFTIHDLDYFQVRFNITDAVNPLDDSTARVWWGVAENSSDGTSGTFLLIERSNNDSWTNTGGGEDVDFGSAALVALEATYVDIIVGVQNITAGGKGGSYNLTPTSFPGIYYHECIYSGVGSQTNSTAIATGQIEVLQSLFTEQGYRA
jgi:hypothetical protein